MRRYAVYKYNYKNLDIEYFITTRKYYKNVLRNIVVGKIRRQGKTIKYLEIELGPVKLNKECQEHIIKYINDYCNYNILKEVPQMKLKDVTHKETFLGKKCVDEFNFLNNRFRLFDKKGRALNPYMMRMVEDVLNIEVLELKESEYANSNYGVGFPVTHIKLDFLDDTKLSPNKFNFGDIERI